MRLRSAIRVVRPIALTAVGCAAVWFAGSFALRRIADRIGDSAGRGEIPAGAATQALHSMRDSATAALVRLATAPEPRIAKPARVALAARVDEWRREAPNSPRRFTSRVERLLAALGRTDAALTRTSKAWAGRFATSLLVDVSHTLPTKRAALLAEIEAVSKTIAKAETLPDPPPPIPAQESPEQQLAADEAVVLPSPPDAPPASSPERATPLPPPPTQNAVAIREEPPWNPEWSPPEEPRSLVAGPSQPLPPSPPTSSPLPQDTKSPEPTQSGEPTDRELLAALLAATDHRASAPVAQGPRSAGERYGGLDPQTREISQALYERGYRGVSLRHVRALLSDDPVDRTRLVERLLVDKTGDTTKLLLLLAYDDNAEVRAAALTALAASPRRELVEASWEIAVRDPDPRVGRLAESIGERLR